MGDKLGLGPSSRLENVVGFMLCTSACVHVVGFGTRQGWQITARTVVKGDELGPEKSSPDAPAFGA